MAELRNQHFDNPCTVFQQGTPLPNIHLRCADKIALGAIWAEVGRGIMQAPKAARARRISLGATRC